MKAIRWIQNHRWARITATLLFIVVPLGILIDNLIRNWNTLSSLEFHPDVGLAASSFLCLFIAFGILPLACQQVLALFGYSIPYGSVYRIFFMAQFGKYAPGGIWIVPYRGVLFAKIGVDAISSTSATFLEIFLLLVSSAPLFFPYIIAVPAISLFAKSYLKPIAIILTLSAVSPWLLRPLLRWLLRRFGNAQFDPKLSPYRLLLILFLDLVFWFITGFGFLLLVSSVHHVKFDLWLQLSSAFSIAWVAGFLAFLTPGGLGVREGVLAFLLTPFLPPGFPALVAISARLWWSLAELCSIAIAAMIGKNASIRNSV